MAGFYFNGRINYFPGAFGEIKVVSGAGDIILATACAVLVVLGGII